MRDGIPRGLPVPRKWQVFVECATRAADRGTERPGVCLCEALHEEMRRDFPNERRNALNQLRSGDEGFLPGIATSISASDPILSDLLAEISGQIESGAAAPIALRDAIAARMESIAAARQRQITEDLAGKLTPAELKQASADIEREYRLIDFKLEATRFLEQFPASPPLADTSVKADEDLRGRQ